MIGVISLLLGEYLIPRSVLVAYALFGPLVLGGNRAWSRWLRLRREGPTRVLLVGGKEALRLAESHIARAGRHIVVIGHAGDVIGIEERVAKDRVTDVILLDSHSIGPLYDTSLAVLERRGVATLQLVLLSTHTLTDSQARLKRWMDLLVLIVTAPVTVPLALFTTIYVAIVVGRPLMFVQLRVGRHGTPFRMLKFRTMTRDAEAATGPIQAAVDDPRVIRGVSWIRANRLDELPQLLNVLQGSMPVVGPRLVRPEELAAYERAFPGYRRRHQSSPGITGLAQVYGGYRTHIEYKLGQDLHYLANWSPIRDLQIMVRTAWMIITRQL